MGILGNGHEFAEYSNPFELEAARNLFMEWFDLD